MTTTIADPSWVVPLDGQLGYVNGGVRLDYEPGSGLWVAFTSAGGPQTITPDPGVVRLTAGTVTVASSSGVTITPAVGVVRLTSGTVSPAATGNTTTTPTPGTITLTSGTVTVASSSGVTIVPSPGILTLSGGTIGVGVAGPTITPDPGVLRLLAGTVTVTGVGGTTVVPPPGVLLFRGGTINVTGGGAAVDDHAVVLRFERSTVITPARFPVPKDSSPVGRWAHTRYVRELVNGTPCAGVAYTNATVTAKDAVTGAPIAGWVAPTVTPLDGTLYSWSIDYGSSNLGALPVGRYIFELTADPGFGTSWEHRITP